MSKKNYTETDVFLCNCGSPEHQIIFQVSDFSDGMDDKMLDDWPVEERQMMTIHFNLSQYRGFFKRLGTAIKYLFGYKSKYGHFDCIILNYDDAKSMIKSLQKYTNLVEMEKDKETLRQRGILSRRV